MRRFLSCVPGVVFFTAAVTLFGCASSGAKLVSVQQVGRYVEAATSKVAILDANTDDVRKEKDTVPGAIKLSSYDKYAFSELPQDKGTLLIFYCYNWLCTASDDAADRAIKAGYTNVARMRDGITGWQDFKSGAKK